MQPPRNRGYQEEKTHEIADDVVLARNRRILLLEDDCDLARTLKDLLESANFQVDVVGNGAEGLKQILERDYDAIVCDMVMPNFPGDMFYLAVQRTKAHLCRRFVFTTGHRADPKIDGFIRQVKGLVLWKPFQPHELFDAIQIILHKNAKESRP